MDHSNFRYKAGALVIGSLLWDNGERSAWRKESFGFGCIPESKRIRVNVPIRYGRFSSKRRCYTMVFSQEFYEQQKNGTAWVIPFQRQDLNIDELLAETKRMSSAEESKDDKFLKRRRGSWWCIITHWLNPKMDIEKKELFHEEWQKHYDSQLSSEKFEEMFDHFKMESEAEAVFDMNGSLKFPWPAELKDFDLVIATQTQPILMDGLQTKYPTPQEIAFRFINNDNYFRKNREYGITTDQDEEIDTFLEKKGNSLVFREIEDLE